MSLRNFTLLKCPSQIEKMKMKVTQQDSNKKYFMWNFHLKHCFGTLRMIGFYGRDLFNHISQDKMYDSD